LFYIIIAERRGQGGNKKNQKMKRFLVLAGCFITLTCACFAQDVIVTRDSRKINAIVTQVNLDYVRFKHFDKPHGLTYMLKINDVIAIYYQNGQVETFETENTRNQAANPTFAQPQNQRTQQLNQYQDVVYLKNGSVIRGVIIEQISNQSIKIETADGNLFVFQMAEIEKLAKFPLQTQGTTQANNGYQTQQTNQPNSYRPYRNIRVNYSRMQIDAPMLYRQYRSGKARGATGWTFITMGIIANIVGTATVLGSSGDNDAITAGYVTYFVGDVFILIIGMPTAISGKIRRVKARNAYEQYIRYGETKATPQFKINLHSNGVGLAYVF